MPSELIGDMGTIAALTPHVGPGGPDSFREAHVVSESFRADEAAMEDRPTREDAAEAAKKIAATIQKVKELAGRPPPLNWTLSMPVGPLCLPFWHVRQDVSTKR
jgi:hypothetical protein